MSSNLTVIYITGLNDSNVSLQKNAVNSWRIFGVNPIFFQTRWSNNESFKTKKEQLLELIDRELDRGNTVSIFAVSAGASLAISAYLQRKSSVSAMVFVCGKILRPEIVAEKYFEQNPAFRKAMSEISSNVAKLNKGDREKILSLSPIFDETVTKRDTFVRSAKNSTLPFVFHAPTIAIAISLLAFIPLSFLKQKSSSGVK